MIKLQDLSGKAVSVGAPCIAEHYNGEGVITVYGKTPEDIATLVRDMKAAGETDPQFLDEKFWLLSACASTAASKCSEGTGCTDGKTCKTVFSTGGFSFCMCKA
jgi:hypothetical protein